MDLALIVSVQVLYAIATLVIISAGLAVIFGMMRVINLAHGEFLMLGDQGGHQYLDCHAGGCTYLCGAVWHRGRTAHHSSPVWAHG
jgi:acetylornithine/succinyldiaminopimelate/putrescine aminotransferase